MYSRQRGVVLQAQSFEAEARAAQRELSSIRAALAGVEGRMQVCRFVYAVMCILIWGRCLRQGNADVARHC